MPTIHGPIKHLTPADYRVMAWKNGGGSTTEIALAPDPDGGFAWRVSMADLKASGPFSAFPGIDRIITPLSGPAFRLTHDGGAPHEVTPLVPYAFSGDWATSAELTGPGQDYNVMVRRPGAAWTEVLSGPTVIDRTYPKGVVVITALSAGTVNIDGNAHVLKPFDSLVGEAPRAVSFAARGSFIVSAIVT